MNNLTPGERFLIRKKPKTPKQYSPSTAFLIFLLMACIVATFLEVENLPRVSGQVGMNTPLRLSISNEDVCRELMDGKYSATVNIYKYCNSHGVR